MTNFERLLEIEVSAKTMADELCKRLKDFISRMRLHGTQEMTENGFRISKGKFINEFVIEFSKPKVMSDPKETQEEFFNMVVAYYKKQRVKVKSKKFKLIELEF